MLEKCTEIWLVAMHLLFLSLIVNSSGLTHLPCLNLTKLETEVKWTPGTAGSKVSSPTLTVPTAADGTEVVYSTLSTVIWVPPTLSICSKMVSSPLPL